jgi:hypothetical protein
MPIALVLIGLILIVVAFNNTMGELAKELEADIPGFFIWILAIAVILGLGYVPGLKQPSRWLLGLVVLVVVLVNYQAILTGFKNFQSTGSAATAAGTAPANPSTTEAAAPGAQPTAAQVSGGAASSSSSTSSASGALGTAASSVAGLAGAAAGSVLGGGFGGGGLGLDPSSYISDAASLVELGGLL